MPEVVFWGLHYTRHRITATSRLYVHYSSVAWTSILKAFLMRPRCKLRWSKVASLLYNNYSTMAQMHIFKTIGT